jgi:hypothetical protein
MDKRARILTVMLSLAILVSLTLACSIPGLPGGGGVTPSEEETPGLPPAGETPASEEQCGDGVCAGPENAENCPQDCAPPEASPAPPEEEMPFGLDVDALDGLDSYAYTLHMDGLSSAEGAAEELLLDIEGKRQSAPTRAEHLKFSSSSDGDTEDLEVVYIEDAGKMWMREGSDAWQELPVMDEGMLQMFDAFSMFYWWDALFVGDPEDTQYVGQEVVNGVACHHYRAAESASWGGAFLSGCTFASVEDDIWVAVDGAFPVKRQLNAEADCQGEGGKFSFLMEVRDVNQPLNITPPM